MNGRDGRRDARIWSTAAISALTLSAAGLAGLTSTAAANPPPNAYRHGPVPVLVPGAARQGPPVVPGRQAAGGTTTLTNSANNLSYGGGINQVGVTTGAPKVYLVFWGSQWGTQGTDGAGNATLTGDAQGMAPRLQNFFKGLGGANELWSGVMTQYCEGVSVGTQFCPAGSAQVGYPSGGALAGIWVDTSASAPSQASATQLGQEAVNAAGHFSKTTPALNRDVQYFIVSPSGTHPDGFNTRSANFCAWHDYSGDPGLGVTSPYGDVAFTNMPYVTDMGASCGQDFVNSGSAGTLDGVTIVGGHEYAETITDQFPAGGWTDSKGYENGDKCAWISSGQGASQDVAFGTGSFAVQSTWANDFNGGSGGCEVSHPIVTSAPPSPDYTLSATPSSQTATQGATPTYNVSVAESGGFSGSVNLSVSSPNPLPTGMTATFDPSSTATTSTLSVATTTATPVGTYTLTITGTGTDPNNQTITHTTNVTLVVQAPQPDFSLSPASTSLTVARGAGTTDAININRSNGFNGAVTFSISGLPNRATGTFSPNPATTTSSTLSLTTNRKTQAGTYHLTITGKSGSLTHTTTVTLTVQ
jgi:serine protease